MTSIGRMVAVGSPVAVAGPVLQDHLWAVDKDRDHKFTDLVGPAWTDRVTVRTLGNDTPIPFALTDQLRFVVNAGGRTPNAFGWGLARRTKDGGATWDDPGTPPNFVSGGMFAFAKDAGVDRRIWCIAHTDHSTWTASRILYSDNDGDIWTEAFVHGTGASSQQSRAWKILPHPTNQNRITVIGFQANIGPSSNGWMRTTEDRGLTWGPFEYAGAIRQGQGGVIQLYDAIHLPSGRIVVSGPFVIVSPVRWYTGYSDDDGVSWNMTIEHSDTSARQLGLFHNSGYTRIAYLFQNLSTIPYPLQVHVSTDQGATFNLVALDEEFEDMPSAPSDTFQAFTFSASRDALYWRGAGNGGPIWRLSPVSASGKWQDITLDYPIGSQNEDNIEALS